MTVSIKIQDDRAVLSAPYHPRLPAKAKAAGGRWHASTKTWRFDARDAERVRDIARDIYGTDGEAGETVTVRLTLDSNYGGRDGESIFFAGREIARRRSRDEQVRLGDGVVLIEGGFPSSGGSRQYPTVNAKAGTVVEIRDVPAGHSDLQADDVTVIDTSIDRDALIAERDRLVERLAQIEELLK